MLDFCVINTRTKVVVYRGSRAKCSAVIRNYPKRPYKIAYDNKLPMSYIRTYHLNMIGHSDVSFGQV